MEEQIQQVEVINFPVVTDPIIYTDQITILQETIIGFSNIVVGLLLGYIMVKGMLKPWNTSD